MSASRRLLIFGGLTLAAFGMLYGLYYALFAEHQALDRMGSALTGAFVHAAERHPPESDASLQDYARTKYVYTRQVDVHSHWIGLAMLLIALGVVFDRVGFSEPTRRWIALALLCGASVFPLGVLLQTTSLGAVSSALAIIGSACLIGALALTAVGFAHAEKIP